MLLVLHFVSFSHVNIPLCLMLGLYHMHKGHSFSDYPLMQCLMKAASSLACARRGWVNVDIDRIECESCGAILKSLSSTPGTPSQGELLW